LLADEYVVYTCSAGNAHVVQSGFHSDIEPDKCERGCEGECERGRERDRERERRESRASESREE
jgi:hypothetical protein